MIRILAVLGIVALATIAVAFASFDPGPAPLPADPDDRGTFTFAIPNDPGNMDPGRTSASTDFRVVKCIYETLLVNKWVKTKEEAGLEPGTAAAMPDISADGLTYTFKLRKDAKWSDGHPVHADDFVYGWRRAMLTETASDYATLFQVIEGVKDFTIWRHGLLNFANLDESFADKDDERKAFLERYPDLENQAERLEAQAKWDLTLDAFEERVGIKALDEHTLQIKLASPTAYFSALCAFPTFSPLPEHVMEPMETIDKAGWFISDNYFGDPEQLVTNGPYTLSEWRRKVRMVFDQNPHYWNKDGMGNIRIVQETIPDPSLQVLRFEEGLLDWIPDVGAIKLKLKEIDYPHMHTVPNAGTYYYQFNCRPTLPNGVDNPMSDPRVRRAMAMCINRKEIVENVTRMNEPVALLIVPDEDIPGYTGPIEAGVKFDPEGAKALLAEAGYPNGEGFPAIEILVNNDAGPGHANMALPIKKTWQDALGLKVKLEQIEFKVLLERSKKGNFFTRRAGWFGDYVDPTTWLDMHRTDDSNNDGKYLNPAYDELLKKAAVELDTKKRFDLLAQAEAMLLQDAPIVPIFYYATVMVYDKETTDLRPNAWNNLRLELIPMKRKDAE